MLKIRRILEAAIYIATRELKIPPTAIRGWMQTYLPLTGDYEFCDEGRIAVIREILGEGEPDA